MSVVSYKIEGQVAVIAVENPPVNALSHAVRAGLHDAITRFADDAVAQIAVIYGVGRLFLGGADITEFGKTPQAPLLPDVVRHIDACAKPVIAALHGATLGGGLEIAMGARYRLAMPGARLGMPEVNLGLIPGACGTQQLPRLVGVEQAAKLVTSGTPVDADTALRIGLVDHVAGSDDLLAEALGFAKAVLATDDLPAPVSQRPVPAPAEGALDSLRASLTKRARGQIAPFEALDLIAATPVTGFAEGVAQERAQFETLLQSDTYKGMVHAFFAERKVSKLPELQGVDPRATDRIGVIGGGTMGAGIATSALLAGLHVTLIERDMAAADKARATITRNLQGAVKRGKLDAVRADEILAQALVTDTDYDALSQADLAIEAVFESMEVKHAVFAELDRVLRPGAVLATNTSYLDINEIAAATTRPGDVIGLHFFSPAHVMKLLEVVVAQATVPDVVATGFALAKRLGKTAVRAGVCDGFIGNRVLSHYRSAADHMVLDGASPYQVDQALVDFGFAMGPYQVSDLAGLDIGFATRQRRAATAHPRDRVPSFADALYHQGRLGQKTGQGYYIYDADSPRGRTDPAVTEIVAQARADAGLTARDFAADEIVRRYMAAMVNEAARVLDEGIAQRPLDVDVVFVHGYGFPRWRGGPLKYADLVGPEKILSDIRAFAAQDDHFWQPAPLLERLVAQGALFESLNQG